MSHEENRESPAESQDLVGWFAGRRSEVERWVEETSDVAVAKVRGVLANEIHALSKRVEQMHSLLDQLEQIVNVPVDDEGMTEQDD